MNTVEAIALPKAIAFGSAMASTASPGFQIPQKSIDKSFSRQIGYCTDCILKTGKI
jgi:hypothetical protein